MYNNLDFAYELTIYNMSLFAKTSSDNDVDFSLLIHVYLGRRSNPYVMMKDVDFQNKLHFHWLPHDLQHSFSQSVESITLNHTTKWKRSIPYKN